MGRELKVKSAMELERVAGYLNELADSLLVGAVTVQKGDEYVVLSPSAPVWVEIEAEQGKHKESFSLEISWALSPSVEEAADLTISSEPPVVPVEDSTDEAAELEGVDADEDEAPERL